jgi:hypothetical protein
VFCIDCEPEHSKHASVGLEEKRASLDKLPSLFNFASAFLSTMEDAVQTMHTRLQLLDKQAEEASKEINEEMDKVRSRSMQ